MFQEFLQPCDNALMAGENYDAQQLGSYIVSDPNPGGYAGCAYRGERGSRIGKKQWQR
jgi:hypothetical protein